MATLNTNGKRMAMATATLVVQYAYSDTIDSAGIAAELERSIDTTDALRRAGGATIQQNLKLVEVRCDIEYGPIRANDADMRRHLERQTHEIASRLGAQDSAVFNVVHAELTSDQVAEFIGKLTDRSNDIGVPLPLRKQLATVVTRLRQGKDAGRVPRMSS